MVHGTSPNPLRRLADRTRARWLVGLGLSVLFAVLSAVASGLAVWSADSRTARSEAAFAAITVGGTVAALIALTAAAVVHLRLRTIEAHSLSAWERDWKRVEPGWSGRLPTESGADDD